jgi:hypothetical protein
MAKSFASHSYKESRKIISALAAVRHCIDRCQELQGLGLNASEVLLAQRAITNLREIQAALVKRDQA